MSKMFHWKPLSKKQLKILTWWREKSPVKECDFIFAHGSIRSGKTLPMSFSFVQWAMECFDNQLFGMAGKTIGSFRMNVLRNLKKILRGREYAVEDRKADKILRVSGYGKTNEFELFGGKDESSQELIQGRTLAGLYLDEATLMPQTFINQALGRLSVPGSKGWMNTNPGGPFHFLKTDFLDMAEEKKIFALHFELGDNLSLSSEIKTRLENLYSGLFYQRYILGQWVMAEGAIYDMFEKKSMCKVFIESSKITSLALITARQIRACLDCMVLMIRMKYIELLNTFGTAGLLDGRKQTGSMQAI